MKALKGVVILMTLTIAVLMTLIAYGMYQKSQDPNFKFFNLGNGDKSAPSTQTVTSVPQAPVADAAPRISGPAATEARNFGDITLALPPGSQITSTSLSGQRLTIVFGDDSGRNQQIWILDLASGQVLGRVKTQP